MKPSDLNDKHIVFVGVGKGRSFDGFKEFINKQGVKPASLEGVDKKAGSDPLGFLADAAQADGRLLRALRKVGRGGRED